MYAKRINYHNLHNRLMVTGSLAQFVESHSTNLGINFDLGFFFFLTKAFSWIIFSIFLEYLIIKLQTKRIKLTLLFKLNSFLNSSFTLTLGYLNLALNNLALIIIIIITTTTTTTTTNNNNYYYTLQSPSVFSLAKSLQLILGNSATYRLFTNLYLQISE